MSEETVVVPAVPVVVTTKTKFSKVDCSRVLVAWKRCLMDRPTMGCSSVEKYPKCATMFKLWKRHCALLKNEIRTEPRH